MSNVASTGIQAKNQPGRPHIPPYGAQQQQFNTGSRNMLEEARQAAENASGQGSMLNPLIYQMLGLKPTFEDHTAELQAAQQELDASQSQWDEAKKTQDTIKAIPLKKRTPEQKKQLRQLNKQVPKMTKLLEDAKDRHGNFANMPKVITGLERLPEDQIPKESPFSSMNPLNQLQRTTTERANQYLSGDLPVDPTLVHHYNDAEAALRGKLADRYGPDYENSSVGQMALQNFGRQKNEAYATWNQNMQEKYANEAFQYQGNLQSLLGNQIGMMREPSGNQMQDATALSNIIGQRLAQQQTVNQRLNAIGGLGGTGVSGGSIAPLLQGAAGGLGSLLSTPYATGATNAAGQPVTTSLGSQAIGGLSDLGQWAAGGIGEAASAIGSGIGAAGSAIGSGANALWALL